MKIRTRVIVVIFMAFVLMSMFVGGVLVYMSNKVVRDQAYSYLHVSSRSRAENVNTYLRSQENYSRTLASNYLYEQMLSGDNSKLTKDLANKRLNSIASIEGDILELYIINKEGIIVAATDVSEVGESRANDLFFTNAKTGTYIKSVYFDDTLKRNVYSVSSPVKKDGVGDFLGVSVIVYKTTDLYEMVATESGLGSTEESFLVNKNKYFISPSVFLGSSVILNRIVDTQNVNQCFSSDEVQYVENNGYNGLVDYLGDKGVIESKDYRGVDVIAAHEYIPLVGWCLVTKVDTVQLLDSLSALTMSVIYIFAGSILIWLFLTILIFNRMTAPVVKLNKLVKDAISGNYSLRSDNRSRDEVGVLARNYNLLLDTIVSTRSGIERQVSEQTADIVKKDGELQRREMAILNILDDVKIEKEKAENLAEDLRKFKLAVEGTTEQIVITDPDGILLYANKATKKLTGYSIKDIIGKKAGSKELWGGNMPKEVYEHLWKVIKIDKKPYSGVFTNKRKNGEMYEVSSTLTPILDEKGEVMYFVGIERDITKEREVDRAKTEFVSLASHQLRTPLSSVSWYAEMLLDEDAGKINHEQKKYLEEIYKGNHVMVDLVNSLLNVSRLDLGTFQINPKPVNIRKVIDDVLGEMEHDIKESKQVVEVKCPSDVHEIKADPGLFRIIIQNLVSNAIKYTPEGGKISVDVEYNPEHPRIAYEIKVSDSGYGIPSREKDKIFTKLFRAKNVLDIDTKGSGLGLYIVKSILDESGGNITFDSTEGKGTTFRVTFPASGMKQKNGHKPLM